VILPVGNDGNIASFVGFGHEIYFLKKTSRRIESKQLERRVRDHPKVSGGIVFQKINHRVFQRIVLRVGRMPIGKSAAGGVEKHQSPRSADPKRARQSCPDSLNAEDAQVLPVDEKALEGAFLPLEFAHTNV
jgi:hypothetical protein